MKNLSNIKGTIGNVILNNYNILSKMNSKEEIYNYLENALADVNNKDKDNFLKNIRESNNITNVQYYLFNYMAAGEGMRRI